MDTFRTRIKSQISSLSKVGKVVFGYLICERLLPNYKYFSTIYSFGNPEKIEGIVAAIHAHITNVKLMEDSEIDTFIAVIEDLTPDTNDFETILASFALDSCTSVISTLSFIKDDDYEHILDVATYARDTVDMFIQERDNIDLNNRELEDLIKNDYFMINEVQRQINLIENLKQNKMINESTLNELRAIGIGKIIDVEFFKK